MLKEGGGLLLLTGTLRLPLFFNKPILSLKYYLYLTTYSLYHTAKNMSNILFLTSNKNQTT